MVKNKKYFWFKLKEDFFQSVEMKMLRKMPSGADMMIVLLKLQLHSLKTNGVIETNGLCETVEEEISYIIEEDKTLIALTLGVLKKFSLVNLVDQKDVQMLLHNELVGVETDSTIRSRKHRALKDSSAKSVALQQKCNTEIEKDIEIELELDIEKDNKKKKPDFWKELDISDDLRIALKEYLKFRTEIKKPLKEMSIKTIIKQIGTKYTNEQHLIETINDGIASGYQGLFPKVDNKTTKQTKNNEYVPTVYKKSETTKLAEEGFDWMPK